MKGVNLHATVRQAITGLHPEEVATLYRSMGNTNVRGVLTPSWGEGESVLVQVQSISDDALYHSNRTGQNATTRKIWMTVPASDVGGVDRETGKGGDMIQLPGGSWWLVDAVLEDFGRSGWKSLRIVRQTKAPVL